MAHEAHHDSHQTADSKSTSSTRASFWFVVILVGLFISAVNFVAIMGNDEGGHEAAGHSTEHTAPAATEASHTAQPAATEHDTETTHEEAAH